MNVAQLKDLILKQHPEIHLVNLGMEDLARSSQETVLLREILEDNADESYYLKSSIVEEILKTKEFGKRFSCIKTKKFFN